MKIPTKPTKKQLRNRISLAKWMAQQKVPNFMFATKKVFPNSLKFMNSGSEGWPGATKECLGIAASTRRPRLIFPGSDRKSPKTASAGPAGSARRAPWRGRNTAGVFSESTSVLKEQRALLVGVDWGAKALELPMHLLGGTFWEDRIWAAWHPVQKGS